MRKHTPPVSTLDPPTHFPAITAMSGVSPTPSATDSPASRPILRRTVDGHRAVFVARVVAAFFDDEHAAPIARELACHDGAACTRADDDDVDLRRERCGLLAAADDGQRVRHTSLR